MTWLRPAAGYHPERTAILLGPQMGAPVTNTVSPYGVEEGVNRKPSVSNEL